MTKQMMQFKKERIRNKETIQICREDFSFLILICTYTWVYMYMYIILFEDFQILPIWLYIIYTALESYKMIRIRIRIVVKT